MVKKTLPMVLAVIAIIIAIIAVTRVPEVTVEEKESTFDRILKEDKLTVCYMVWPPSIIKDPDTGELSGFLIDLTRKIADETDLELEYVESSWGGFPADLNTGRCDAAIGGVFPTLSRSLSASFTRPIFFAGNGAVARTS